MPSREDAAARFERVAKKRLERVIKDLKLLGNCGDKHNYDYTRDHVEKIGRVLEAQIKEVMNKFVAKEDLDISW